MNMEKDIHVSVSIGMCSTEVTEEYSALYRCAESTLKYVKENGKGGQPVIRTPPMNWGYS